jgi:hypothetical protein
MTVLLALLAAQSDGGILKPLGDQTITSKWGIKYVLPKDWTGGDLDKPDGYLVASFVGPNADAWGYCAIERDHTTLEEYFTRLMEDLLDKGASPRVLTKKVEGAVLTAEWIGWTMERKHRYVMRMLLKGNGKFRIVFYCLDKDFARFSALFRRYLELLEVLGDGSAYQTVESKAWGIRYLIPPRWSGGDLQKKESFDVARIASADGLSSGVFSIQEAPGSSEAYLDGLVRGLQDQGLKPRVLRKEPSDGSIYAELALTRDAKPRRAFWKIVDDGKAKFRAALECPESELAILEDPLRLCAREFRLVAVEKLIESQKWGIRYTLPPGWFGGDLASEDGLAVARFQGGEGARGFCTIETKDGTAESYLDSVLSHYREAGVTVAPGSRESIDGGLLAEYALSGEGWKRRVVTRIVAADRVKYRIVFECPDKHFAEQGATFKSYALKFGPLRK